MIVIIDNYDSFTYNLVQYLGELQADLCVYRNDEISVGAIEALQPQAIVISPGPGAPQEAGISMAVIERLGSQIPILGVCLGHQCIGQVYGGQVRRAAHLMHGKTSLVHHSGDDLYQGVPNPFEANRYHSLIVAEPAPPALQVTAYTRQGEIMGLRHRQYPVHGVQFHPESILTPAGIKILANFLVLSQAYQLSARLAAKSLHQALGA
jgi:anthranilate synthase/aminodeoxychorismate synthase-like glutamine amidotransferase